MLNTIRKADFTLETQMIKKSNDTKNYLIVWNTKQSFLKVQHPQILFEGGFNAITMAFSPTANMFWTSGLKIFLENMKF